MPAVLGDDIPHYEPRRSVSGWSGGVRRTRGPEHRVAAPPRRVPEGWNTPGRRRSRRRLLWTLPLLALAAAVASSQLGPRVTTARQRAATGSNSQVSPSALPAHAGRPRRPSVPQRVAEPQQDRSRARPSSPRVSIRQRVATELKTAFRGAARQAVRTTEAAGRAVAHTVPRAVRFVTRVLEQVVGS